MARQSGGALQFLNPDRGFLARPERLAKPKKEDTVAEAFPALTCRPVRDEPAFAVVFAVLSTAVGDAVCM